MVLAAVGQFCATNSLISNAAIIRTLIRKASEAGAKVLFLPEASDFIATSPEESVSLTKPLEHSPVYCEGILRGLADLPEGSVKPYISVGFHEPAEDTSHGRAKRLRNTLVWIGPDGSVAQRYQKLHLFDVDISNGPILKESRSVEPGTKLLPPFDTPIGKLGSAICYDIRFPEMAMRLRSLGAEVIVFPSAFTVRTGAAHWEVLARARAIDTQCFVIMAGLVGKHDKDGKRQSYGHSIIVDPWGTVLAQAPDVDSEPRIITADIDLSVLKTVRENMPLWDQRRPDVFGYEI